MDSRARTIFVADAHRDDRRRFVVRADEKLTVFVELESAIRATKTRKSKRQLIALDQRVFSCISLVRSNSD